MAGLRLVVLAVCAVNMAAATKSACCRESVMRLAGYAFLETDSQLVPRNWEASRFPFFAIRLRACSTHRFNVQLWDNSTSTTENQWKLVWQYEVKPQKIAVPVTYKWTDALILKPSYKLAMQAIKVPGEKTEPSVPVPYDFNADYLAIHSEGTGQFQVGEFYNFTTIQWPISFTRKALAIRATNMLPSQQPDNILFCTDPKCSTGLSQDIPLRVRIIAGPPGPPGPVGPPGRAGNGNGNSGANSKGECCNDPNVKAEKEKYKRNQNQMATTIDTINNLVSQLVTGTQPTGKCPSGFTPGKFGVGNCYFFSRVKVPMLNAEMICRSMESHLVSVKKEIEQQFLKTHLSALYTNRELKYWSSGMYSERSGAWVWYDEGSRTSVFSFTKWAPGQDSVSNGGIYICLLLEVAPDSTGQVDLQWKKANCGESAYFVCQLKKDCL